MEGWSDRARSWYLGDLIDNHSQAGDKRGREFEVLGELQFAFLMVLTLNNNSCLEQWKRILSLLFTCRQAVKERSQLFLELLRTLRVQLDHCVDMDGFFDMNEVGGGFLRPLLRRFRKNLDDFDGKWKSDMMDELDELEDYLQKQFGWERGDSFVKRGMLDLEDGERVEMDVNDASEDEESGDYAPTVVELTPAQLKGLSGGDADSEKDTADSEEEADLDDMDERY
jgi:A1 cistron-splicing factor AAR2